MVMWLALAVLVVGLVGGAAYAAIRGLSLWRQLKRTSRTLGDETARISRAVDQITSHLERAGASGERLGAAIARLRASQERLRVQLAAVSEARSALARTFWFLPGL